MFLVNHKVFLLFRKSKIINTLFFFPLELLSAMKHFQVISNLFPNTKLPKNRMQYIIRRDIPRDFRKMIQGLADVYGKKIGWDAEGHAV